MGKAATFSAITFLWASSTQFDLYAGKPAILTKSAGGTVTLNPPTYDSVTDTLRLNIVGQDVPTDSWNFWDIVSITIGK